MQTQYLGEGLTIYYRGRVLEWVRQTDNSHWFSDVETGDFEEFSAARFLDLHATQEILVVNSTSTPHRLDHEDPRALNPCTDQKSPPPTLLSEQVLQTLNRRADYVEQILAWGISRGQRLLLEDAAQRIAKSRGEPPEAAPSAPTLNRWLKAYQQRHQDINALLPNRWKPTRSSRVGRSQDELLEAAIDQVIFDEGALRDRAVIVRYRALLRLENARRLSAGELALEPVSDSTVYRRIAARPAYDKLVARYGQQEAKRRTRMSTSIPIAAYPLDVAEIDHTQVDWWILDDLLMLPLGLPWITIISDRYSGCVLGIFIAFRKTGLDSIFNALRHSMFAHDKVQSLWPQIENPWVSCGFATTYLSDRGGDFLSERYRVTIRQLGGNPQYCERHAPWQKAAIEGLNGKFSEFFETMPGHTFPFRKAPHGYDPRKHAVIRFSAAVYLIHKWVCDILHQTPMTRKQATRHVRWAEKIVEMPAPIPPSPESLDVISGELDTASLCSIGIRHNWLSYANDQLHDLGRQIGLGRKKVEFIAHVRELGYIHVIDPATRLPFRVECREKDYAWGKTLFQHQYIRNRAGAGLNMSNAHERLLKAEHEIREELCELLTRKESSAKLNLWQCARRAGINSNDVLDGRARSVLDLVVRPPSDIQVGPDTSTSASDLNDPSTAHPSCTDVPAFRWGV